MTRKLTPNLVDAAIALSLSRSLSADERFALFSARAAACREILRGTAINGDYLEANGWQRWQGNKMPIWLLGSPRILWTVDKGLTVVFPGIIVSQF